MSSLLILGDIHLGVRRIEHTTPASRRRLCDHVYRQAYELTSAWAGSGEHLVVQLGDVFDRFSNPEPVIFQGAELLKQWTGTLAGNHDLKNDSESVGSFTLLKNLGVSDCVMAAPNYDRPNFETFAVALGQNVVQLYLIPYAPSQEIFEQTLSWAETHATQYDTPRILCVHCNVDLPFEKTETTLNLTTQRAEKLLETFEYIFCGHEHTSRRLLDGRLIVTGNLFPSRFDELTDKYLWEYTELGEVKAHRVWDANTRLLSSEARRLPEVIPPSVQFLDLRGTVLRTELPDLARKITTFWKDSQNLLAVRFGIDILGATANEDAPLDPALDLKSAIAQWLEGTGLEGAWTELTQDEPA